VVWTVNKPDDMEKMIDLGVDGVISDRPDLLRKVAARKGILRRLSMGILALFRKEQENLRVTCSQNVNVVLFSVACRKSPHAL